MNISDMMNFSMVPWGQGTFVTNACGPYGDDLNETYVWGKFWDGYSSPNRQCFNIMCGANHEDFYGARSPDCFANAHYCQHGGAECAGNAIQACSKKVANEDYMSYGPFAVCFEENYEAIRDPAGASESSTFAENRTLAEPAINATARSCASGTGIDAEAVLECFYSSEVEKLAEMAANTIPHISVPFVRIMQCNQTWRVLDLGEDAPPPSLLVDAVCEAACPGSSADVTCSARTSSSGLVIA